LGGEQVVRLIPHTERCFIGEPTVTQGEQFYPIQLDPGDTVAFTAGGCVQVGGHGPSRRRYVDPQGPDSDQLYHGLIRLPGMPPRRLNDVLGVPITIPTSAPPGFLALGYEDDRYEDNGYWGMDAGVGDQCKTEPNAFVDLAITRAGTGTPIAHPPAYAFRLDQFQIKDTMAQHNDTDTVCLTVKTGSGAASGFPTSTQGPAKAPYIQTRCASVGDVNNGTHSVGWELGPFSVDPSTPVVFTYQIVNKGGTNQQFVDDVSKTVNDAVQGYIESEGHAKVGKVVGDALNAVEHVVFSRCDGVVLSDSVQLGGTDLAAYTAGNVRYSETRAYYGPDTPFGCGANARYNVTWSLAPWVATAP
jgi:hypothetical protein